MKTTLQSLNLGINSYVTLYVLLIVYSTIVDIGLEISVLVQVVDVERS